jgi:hypothetical protein
MDAANEEKIQIITFKCFVRTASGGGEHDLLVNFFRPQRDEFLRAYVAEAEIISAFFQDNLKVVGNDELQSFLLLLGRVHGQLKIKERDGFVVYKEKGGAVDNMFWGIKSTSIYAFIDRRRKK